MRREFEARFTPPKRTHSDRFVWDFWHVPGQYSFHRTPADHFFSPKIFQKFVDHLLSYGEKNLGCSSISPPWLSYYIEGSEQMLHSDVPHGPWAYVFSLSPQKIQYQGGETFLLRPETLDYWPNFRDSEDRELHSLVEHISSPFNQLLVFDPRIPHGVSRVSGVRDPKEARLVVHGWFTEPKPWVKGALSEAKMHEGLEVFVQKLFPLLQANPWHGVLSLRFQVNAKGQVLSTKVLANTLVPIQDRGLRAQQLEKKILHLAKDLRFASAKGKSEVYLPLLLR